MKVIDTDVNFNHFKKQMNVASKTNVEAGYISSDKRRDGEVNNADLALFHEYGTKSKKGNRHIKARPFIRPAFDNNKEKYRKKIVNGIMRSFAKKTFASSTFYNTMEAVGIQMKADIQEAIRSLPRDLAQSTIDNKKSSKALVDTAQMLNSTTFKVNKY